MDVELKKSGGRSFSSSELDLERMNKEMDEQIRLMKEEMVRHAVHGPEEVKAQTKWFWQGNWKYGSEPLGGSVLDDGRLVNPIARPKGIRGGL
ncbi:uncharacterized protein RSE6_01019 [Rhynchosporium secalis]|uniref:Uncharacterized protein n=1 Tax=Rhynchosporium secalis TaxID=38038 RepID=A0A1E1LWP7_RHYSE|nr:uncharacterized protein RSE6_01019 [Rhynchosporium secalis]